MDEKYQNENIRDIFGRSNWIMESTRLSLLYVSELSGHPGKIDIGGDVEAYFHRRYAECGHEMEALVSVLEEMLPVELKRYLHLGLTSSDIMDTVLSYQIMKAINVVVEMAVDDLTKDLYQWEVPGVALGRTHGKLAEPTTWIHRVKVWRGDIGYAVKELVTVNLPGKLSGSMGDNQHVSREVEERVLARYYQKIRRFTAAQCVGRYHYSNIGNRLATMSSILAKIATDMRLLSFDGINEIEVSKNHGLTGTTTSSSMPHKVNPIGIERVTGLARLARGYASALMESVETWNERDISHSVVDKTAIPDLFHIVTHQITCLTGFVKNAFPVIINPTVAMGSQKIANDLRMGGMSRAEARDMAVEMTKKIHMGHEPNITAD